jgi:hypothetical protein
MRTAHENHDIEYLNVNATRDSSRETARDAASSAAPDSIERYLQEWRRERPELDPWRLRFSGAFGGCQAIWSVRPRGGWPSRPNL